MGQMNFRRSVVADTRRKGGKGGRGNYYDRYRLPQNVAMPFLIVPGDYLDTHPDPNNIELDANGVPQPVKIPYFKFRKHRRKTFKNGKENFVDEICSAGDNPHNPQPCVGCMAMDSGDKTVTLSDGFAITIIHLWQYHQHPLFDFKQGGIVMKKENQKEPVMIFSECGGRTCNFCRAVQGQPPIIQQGETWPGYRPQDIHTVFGHRRYFELGKNHLADLIGWDRAVGSQCGGHMTDPRTNQPLGPCRNQLTMVSYNCTVCHSVVIDMANDPRTDEQIDEAVLKPYHCVKCQRPTFVAGVVACERAERNPQMPDAPFCSGAVMYTIFDVVLSGMRQGESTNSHLFMQRFDTVEEFGRSVHPNFLGGKSFKDFITEQMKPFEFSEILKARSLQDQAKRLELPMPAQAGGGYGQPPQNYGQPPQGSYGQPNYGTPPPPQGGYQQPYTGPGPASSPPYPPTQPQQQNPPPPQAPYQSYPPNNPPAPPQNGQAGPPPFVPPGRPNFGN